MNTLKQLLLVVVVLLVSCQHQNHSADTHDHEHEEVSLKFTHYNDEFEVFCEAVPFTNGLVSGIIVHITRLSDFKPLTEGKVTVSITIGNKGIRQTLEAPTRPGIFLFQLQPEVSGKGKLILDVETEGNKTSFQNSIEVFSDEHDALHEAEHQMSDQPNAIAFTKEQSWKINFASAIPKTGPFGEIIKTTAHIQSAQGEEQILTSSTNGIVSFSGKSTTEGTPVSAGNLLFTVSGEKLANNNLKLQFEEARNHFNKAEANYIRTGNLAKDKIVSEKELLDAKTEYINAKAVFENLKQNFSDGGQRIVSSKTGFIKHVFVENGEYVEAGAPLIAITENKNLYLKAEVQQKYAGSLPYLKTANIRIPGSQSVYSLEELNGKIVSYGKNVSDESYLIPLTLQVENRANLFPGSFVEVYLQAESNKTALTIPNSALLEEQGNYSVFVQLNPESFDKRQVAIGKTDGKRTEILSGLAETDRIVTQGAVLIKLAAVSNSLDPHAGHVH